MHNYKNLHIWQEGIKLARKIYEVTSTFPANENLHYNNKLPLLSKN